MAQRQVLTEQAKTLIKTDPLLMGLLCDANNKSIRTMQRWLADDDRMLTTADNLKIVSDRHQIEVGQLLETKEFEPMAEQTHVS